MARKLIAVAPDGSLVETTTDRDYTHFVICTAKAPSSEAGNWVRFSAHGRYDLAVKSLEKARDFGHREAVIAQAYEKGDPTIQRLVGRRSASRVAERSTHSDRFDKTDIPAYGEAKREVIDVPEDFFGEIPEENWETIPAIGSATDDVEYVVILTGAELRKLARALTANVQGVGNVDLLKKLNEAPTRKQVNASLSWGFENDDNPPEL